MNKKNTLMVMMAADEDELFGAIIVPHAEPEETVELRVTDLFGGKLGVSLYTPKPEVVKISKIEDSRAARFGWVPEDKIVAVNGSIVTNKKEFKDLLGPLLKNVASEDASEEQPLKTPIVFTVSRRAESPTSPTGVGTLPLTTSCAAVAAGGPALPPSSVRNSFRAAGAAAVVVSLAVPGGRAPGTSSGPPPPPSSTVPAKPAPAPACVAAAAAMAAEAAPMAPRGRRASTSSTDSQQLKEGATSQGFQASRASVTGERRSSGDRGTLVLPTSERRAGSAAAGADVQGRRRSSVGSNDGAPRTRACSSFSTRSSVCSESSIPDGYMMGGFSGPMDKE